MGQGSAGVGSAPLITRKGDDRVTDEEEMCLAQAAICDVLNEEADVIHAQWKELRAAAQAQNIDRVIVNIRRGGKAFGEVELDCRPVKTRTTKTGIARRLPDGSITLALVEETR